jgi:hypothetical protein
MSYEIIRIVFTDEDIRSMAEAAGIDVQVALDRAEDWAKHVSEAAITNISEQLVSIVVHDQP